MTRLTEPQRMVRVNGQWWVEPAHARVHFVDRFGANAIVHTHLGAYLVTNVPPEDPSDPPSLWRDGDQGRMTWRLWLIGLRDLPRNIWDILVRLVRR